MTQDNSTDQTLKQRRNQRLLALGGGVVVVAVAATAYWTLYASHFVSTDNAYAAVEVAQVTPAIGGTIAEVKVKDTQAGKQGEGLGTVDPTDAQLALAQAEAELGRAVRRVRAYVANDGGLAAQVSARVAEEKRAEAQLSAAQADFERAQIDLKRRQALLASGSVSGDELTKAQNAHAAAQANLASAKAAIVQASANRVAAQGAREANAALIDQAQGDSNPEILLARAKRDQAQVDLERTVIRAPMDGVVAKRQVQLGQRVPAGAPLLSVVPVQDIYVNANFKEGQLQKVRPGQSATVTSVLYGSSVSYHGVVEGLAGGSGSAFVPIPAQNATGNWIKVVQRLPLRIRLDAEELAAHPLKVGLSMTVKIGTRSGAQ